MKSKKKITNQDDGRPQQKKKRKKKGHSKKKKKKHWKQKKTQEEKEKEEKEKEKDLMGLVLDFLRFCREIFFLGQENAFQKRHLGLKEILGNKKKKKIIKN